MMSSIANQCFELDLEYTYKLCCSTTKVNMYIPDPEVQICKVRKPKNLKNNNLPPFSEST